MDVAGEPTPSPDARETFALEEFAWVAPDQLRVSGRFDGLRDAPAAAPVLVVRGERTHRLEAIPDSVSGAPKDGGAWGAVFAWREPPAPFDAAELQLGDGVAVPLPPMDGAASEPRVLEVRRTGQPAAAAGAGADVLRVQAELLAAQDEIARMRASLEDAEVALVRAREDLQAERDRRAADAERFREGLAGVQRSADEAIGVERRRAEELGAALDDVRRDLETARTERSETESQARAEADAMRERLAALEPLEEQVQALRAERDEVAREAEQARAETERVRNRIEVIRRALADEG